MIGSTEALVPLRASESFRDTLQRAGATHRTALTMSRITCEVGISIFSTPDRSSARVGPMLSSKIGFPNFIARWTSLKWHVSNTPLG